MDEQQLRTLTRKRKAAEARAQKLKAEELDGIKAARASGMSFDLLGQITEYSRATLDRIVNAPSRTKD